MQNVIIEKHTYSPELNKLHFKNGSSISIKGLSTIKEVRNKLFNQAKKGKYANISFKHSDKLKDYDKTYAGYIASYRELISFINKMKNKHNLHTTIQIKLKYIG